MRAIAFTLRTHCSRIRSTIFWAAPGAIAWSLQACSTSWAAGSEFFSPTPGPKATGMPLSGTIWSNLMSARNEPLASTYFELTSGVHPSISFRANASSSRVSFRKCTFATCIPMTNSTLAITLHKVMKMSESTPSLSRPALPIEKPSGDMSQKMGNGSQVTTKKRNRYLKGCWPQKRLLSCRWFSVASLTITSKVRTKPRKQQKPQPKNMSFQVGFDSEMKEASAPLAMVPTVYMVVLYGPTLTFGPAKTTSCACMSGHVRSHSKYCATSSFLTLSPSLSSMMSSISLIPMMPNRQEDMQMNMLKPKQKEKRCSCDCCLTAPSLTQLNMQ
mmetsp:Transcript_67695/g.152094  ORF Transcript_67695/g.152094 Transcript_67695/m.152094 type:complete len:330 (-) Transcript_67695:166-1155(-)